MDVRPSPVKERAEAAGIPVFQPASLRDAAAQERLASWAADGADVFVVVAFGLILPKEVIEMPRHGCLNVHFSLLPKFRGAAPVQWALIEGVNLTGVTIMQMDEGLDTGPVISHLEEPIFDGDDAGTLEARLATRGAGLLVEVLDHIASGGVIPKPQNDSMASLAPKLSTQDARIDWSMEGPQIVNRVRAFNPRPGAWTLWSGRRVKVWRASISTDTSIGDPGTIDVLGERVVVDSASERIALEEVQPEGSKRMSGAEFVRGYRPSSGDRLT